MCERLTRDDLESMPLQGPLHKYRYEFASQFAGPTDTVVDAAAGCGYGQDYFSGRWIGVDKIGGEGVIAADLCTWTADFPFDVFVGLETIEHLANYLAYVQNAKAACRQIIISTPIVPTKHFNPFHLHDFTQESLEALFVDEDWKVDVFEQQDGDATYGVWAFGRR